MPRTLFFYIFNDLLRVFLLASGALAGIMSFGGLLRPLTQHGLDLNQVSQMLVYFMPAMTNYSWPVAVLFATTFVYGRLSSDNELTACRAAGLDYARILMPAMLMGIVVALLSFAFLCFVVPHSFLKAERVVYSNLAQLVANQISRTQQVNLNAGDQSITIFARSAVVLQPNPARPLSQAVEMTDVAIVRYLNAKDKVGPRIPQDFYLATSAMAIIEMPKDAEGDVMLYAKLENGTKVPRASDLDSGRLVSMGIGTTAFGPEALASPVRETSKFMDIRRLLELRSQPDKSKRVLKHVKLLAEYDQIRSYMMELRDAAKMGRTLTFEGVDNGAPVTYTIPIARGTDVDLLGSNRLALTRGTVEDPGLQLSCESPTIPFTAKARQIIISTESASQSTLYPKIEVRDATLWYQDQPAELLSKQWNLAVPMPRHIDDLSKLGALDYLRPPRDSELEKRIQATFSTDKLRGLIYDVKKQQNQIESELHSRLSFALSCLVLALVGAIIGMQFKSGNFVSAFAVSVGPALVAIVLIVTGQHICESVPKDMGPNFHDPLRMGLTVLWSGVIAVTAMGLWLFLKLSRT
jgi:lipopolysaccharide export LptBFGC system permease protein LptF